MKRMSDLCVILVGYVEIGMVIKLICKFYMERFFAVENYKYNGVEI